MAWELVVYRVCLREMREKKDPFKQEEKRRLHNKFDRETLALHAVAKSAYSTLHNLVYVA